MLFLQITRIQQISAKPFNAEPYCSEITSHKLLLIEMKKRKSPGIFD